MNNNIEFVMEEEKLQDTISLLNTETLNYIAKRKYITEYIVKARKEYLEEYKDDEDKVTEYFDHESYVKEEAYKTIDRRLKEFNILKESPYFGKITFTEEDEGAEDVYIGRFGLTTEDYEPVIIDWRAPVASLFYKGTLGESTYTSPEGEVEANLLGRRQILVKKGELQGIFDSALDVKDDILQMVLTKNSEDKLKDIVMTIQEEQDNIIRAPRNKVVVVNGVAGSGKTTIALHRVSYLLYNNRKQLGDKVLILGPNDIFMDYIGQVLPSLGEEGGVAQTTFQNFAIDEIGLKEDIKGFSEYIEEAMTGNEEALEEYRYKASNSFVELLDNTILDMEENYFKIKPVKFFGEEIVSAEEIEELFTKYYKHMPLFRRSAKIKRILISKIKDKRDDLVRELNAEVKQKIKEISPDEFEIQKNDLDFRRRIRVREIVRGVMDARAELDKWINNENCVTLYKRISNTEKLGYMDLAGILYLMVKLEGKKYGKEIKHVVIDEAQDYNMTQFKLIKELTGCRSYTIVGDSNQRLISTDEEPAMLHLDEIFGKTVEEFKLNKSYRSTQEIMEYANQFLDENKIVPLVRRGHEVMEEETDTLEEKIETLLAIIEDFQDEGLESIAIITKDKEKLKDVSSLLKSRTKVMTFDREDMIYKGGLVLLPAYYAKGLEFDGVILLDDLKDTPNLVKYIMCTRALHRLAVIK
ncbi:MAG: AAA family ATPase [Clostridium sp.]|uniref:HelD family protein n=1 Tax=Clostridium sp. DSM 8431 TaxID=1761781 RepID=UPI0008E9B021|nr:UvrD-helicase domain-containing protein [Clostridium sp. DSM 8431]MCR4943935.1 AAA family ATPase [Clostridium sp.]SFU81975.1 DNA helicase-2 / ATP-dependent DNA helicase PcrA [Clostridium sp. DSM 8431]